MLKAGLGDVLERELDGRGRFFDLFTGSGTVAHHVAENYPVEVIATDLQEYAATLARSIITRTKPLSFECWVPNWIAAAMAQAERSADAITLAEIQSRFDLEKLPRQVARARLLAAESSSDFVRAYGGWYFSPWQALLLSSLRTVADPNAEWYDVAVAAVVQTASRCVAAPGHTAQPFKADTKAAPFLLEAWRRDVIALVTVCAASLSGRHGLRSGIAFLGDANDVAISLKENDVAFLDPPYSSVHYSRFYHVLESIARGHVGDVSGAGRYPAPEQRPTSNYSIPTKSELALKVLLERIADAGATAIITFPSGETSNRLSGAGIAETASKRFDVQHTRIASRLSTLGGDHKHRGARHDTEELILTLKPY